MEIVKRIQLCQIIEQIKNNVNFSKKLGLEDKSKFHGQNIDKDEK